MTKQHSSNKKALAVVTGILVVLMIAAIVLLALTKGCTDWSLFKKQPANNNEQQAPADDIPSPEDPAEEDNNKYVFKPGEYNLMTLMPVAMSMENHTVDLTATIEPDTALNALVDWKVEYVDPTDEWATGKDINEYVTITPDSDGALTAKLKCLKAFGSQVKVTVTARGNKDAYATCTVDCIREVTITSFNLFTSINYSYLIEDGAIPSKVMNKNSALSWLRDLLQDGKPHFVGSISKGVGTMDEEYTAELSWRMDDGYISMLQKSLPEVYQSKVKFSAITTDQTVAGHEEFFDLVLEAPYLTFIDGYQGYVPGGDLGSPSPKDNTLNMSVTGANIVEFYKTFGLIENDDEFYAMSKETVETINTAFQKKAIQRAVASYGIVGTLSVTAEHFSSSRSISVAFGERNFAKYAPDSVTVTPDQIVF